MPTPSVRHSGTQHGKQRVGGYLVRQKESTQAGNSTNKSFFIMIDDQLRPPQRGRCAPSETYRRLPARRKFQKGSEVPTSTALRVFPSDHITDGAVGRSHNDVDGITILKACTDFVDRKNPSARIARMTNKFKTTTNQAKFSALVPTRRSRGTHPVFTRLANAGQSRAAPVGPGRRPIPSGSAWNRRCHHGDAL